SKAAEVRSQLPAEAEDPVISREAADATALMYISFSSETLSNPQITDYLSRVVQPRLATLPGVADAAILGRQNFAMRLWLDPVRMAAMGVTASDVNQAVRRYNFLAAAGETKGEYVVTSVNAATDLQEPEQFAAIPVRTDGDTRVLIGDIARVELGAESLNAMSFFNGIPAVYIGVEATTTANPLDVIAEVRKALPQIDAQLPPELEMTVAYDATQFIQESIDEVIKTLTDAGTGYGGGLACRALNPGVVRGGDQGVGRFGRDRHRDGITVARLGTRGDHLGPGHPPVDDRRAVLRAAAGLFVQPADPAGPG